MEGLIFEAIAVGIIEMAFVVYLSWLIIKKSRE
jgi:hypothetical protein